LIFLFSKWQIQPILGVNVKSKDQLIVRPGAASADGLLRTPPVPRAISHEISVDQT